MTGDEITQITNEEVFVTIKGESFMQRYHQTIKNEAVRILKELKEKGDTPFLFLRHKRHIYGIIGWNTFGIVTALLLSELVIWDNYDSKYYINEKES